MTSAAPPPDAYHPFHILRIFHPVPIEIPRANDSAHLLTLPPLFSPLLFPNTASDARDHCANERTFLSYLRLSIYLSVVSLAILISFHLKNQPSHTERVISLPLGIVFFVLALMCLSLGFGNYVRTVVRYSRRQALVQSGWKTQAVVGCVAGVIVGCCVLFLSVQAGVRGG
jgi:uncharacterized membrane protein YidH (DUF202 family)